MAKEFPPGGSTRSLSTRPCSSTRAQETGREVRPGLRPGLWLVIILIWAAVGARTCRGYSLLTHEEVVDIVWKDQLRPMLLKRFPGASEMALQRAHAFAYGGCLINDIGFYPFGDIFFSDLTHYVRSGDFVANLIQESADASEYAFALGVLAHYSSDISGHPLINHAVALAFPKLRAKYGETVTYEQDPKAHIRTEFGFDVTQVAKNRYTSDRYHDFIGFQVSRPLIERAFLRTYGLPLEDVLGHESLAIGTFRRSVSRIIPEMTRAALSAYHPEMVRDIPNFNQKEFLYNLSRAQFEAEWGKEYRRPGLIARMLGLFVRVVPKIWLLRPLAISIPTSQTEDLYMKSVNVTVESFRRLLRQVEDGNLRFPNLDCDTGGPTVPGEYALADETYGRLLEALVRDGLTRVQPDLRANILEFYAGGDPPRRTRKPRKAWRQTSKELAALEAGPGSPITFEVRKQLLAPPIKLQSPKAKDADF